MKPPSPRVRKVAENKERVGLLLHHGVALGVAVASTHLKAEDEAAKLFHRNGANGAAVPASRWRAMGRVDSMRKEGR